MIFYISFKSLAYLLPITFYQLPYTIYQLPVYPLDKCIVEIRLLKKKDTKNIGLLAAFLCCELNLQSYFKSVPGVWSDPDSGANPLSNAEGNAPSCGNTNMMSVYTGKTMAFFIICFFSEPSIISVSLLISNKRRLEICQ